MSLDNIPPELLAKPQKPWITWTLAILLIFGVTSWLWGGRLLQATRSYIAIHYANKAAANIVKKDWLAAQAEITLAQRWGAQHPRVIRVVIQFLEVAGNDSASLLHALNMLEMAGQAEDADYLKMGQIYVLKNDITRTLQTLKKLKPETQQKRPALELFANLQRLRGKTQDAERTLRHALSLEPNDSMCRLRLALMDQQATFSEMRMASRGVLWQLTTGNDRAALLAIDTLCESPELNVTEAEQMLKSMEANPGMTSEKRFKVVSAIIRTRPQQRLEIINTEIAASKKFGEEELSPLLAWLLKEHEPARILGIQKGDLFTKSNLLIQPYLQALGDLDRWAEVETILARPAGMPVSPAFIAFWRAKASRHTDRDSSRTRLHLSTVYETSGHGRDVSTAVPAAALAEETGQWDIAVNFYEGLAENQPQLRVPMLEKVQEMAMRDRDTASVLNASERLVTLRPENLIYADQFTYIHLLSGQRLEIILEKLDKEGPSAGTRIQDHFFHALAHYRRGDLEKLRSELNTISDVSQLTVGQRAVHAGLLSISGKVGPAFQIAELIPSILLLEEERRFLNRAL